MFFIPVPIIGGNIITSIIGGIITAWVLGLFGFKDGFKELFPKANEGVYYMIFIFLSLMGIRIISGIIGGIAVGWLLSLFGFDDILRQFIKKDFSKGAYYLVFILLSIFVW